MSTALQALPRISSGGSLANRPDAIVRFAEDNSMILRKQTAMLGEISDSLLRLEEMLTLQFNLDKKSAELDAKRLSMDKLAAVEAAREGKNASAPKRSGSLLGAAAKFGLGALGAAFMVGFVGELLSWGESLKKLREKFFGEDGYFTNIQKQLNKWGQTLEDNGMPKLADLVRSLGIIVPVVAGLAAVLSPFKAVKMVFAPIGILFKSLGSIGKFLANNPVAKITEMFSKTGPVASFFGKLAPFFRVLGRLAGPIGIAIALVEGIIGAFKGFQTGMAEGGFLVAVREGFIGLVDGLVGGLVDMFADLLGWILEKLGFEELGKKFSEFNFGDFFGTIIDNFSYGIEMIIHQALGILDVIKKVMRFVIAQWDKMALPEWLGGGSVGSMVPEEMRTWVNTKSQGEAPKAPGVRTAGKDAEAASKSTADFSDVSVSVGRTSAPPSSGYGNTPTTGNMVGGFRMAGHVAAAESLGEAVNPGKTKGWMKDVFDAFIAAGFSRNQAVALAAEVGRENDYNPNAMFGSHVDAANGKKNIGIFSWQSDRYPQIMKWMSERGLVNEDGTFQRSAQSLIAQAQFAKHEMMTTKRFAPTREQFLANPNVDAATAAKVLGKNYIGWAYGQSVLKSGASFDWQKHDRKRAGYAATFSGSSQMSAGSTPSSSSGASLQTSTAAVVAAKSTPVASGPAVASIDQSRTNVTNQTNHQAANISASTPVEFAPHVV